MKIIFHGGAREVGKSCIELQTEGKRYIMDAGVKFVAGGNEYPKQLDKIHDLDGLFISHAHLDHSGAIPMLEHKQLNCPIYMTPLTWHTVNLLLEDSYHLEKLKHLHPAYIERDIKKIKNDLRFVQYDKEYQTPDKKIKFSFLNSGHIPGGASILMEVEGKTLLYTGDINTERTNLMEPSDLHKYSGIDVLITENTYGDRPHPDKKESEDELIESIHECLNRGGSALVPAFSVGRSQDILITLSKLPNDIPIYLDGMARKLLKLVVESDDPYVNNKDILAKMMKRVIMIQRPNQREEVAKKKGIVIVTTSGMVQGGPVVTYVEKMLHDEKNSILLTGYQAQGTNGRHIFEDHLFYHHGQRFKVKAQVKKFDFSAHYGQNSIHELIEKIQPKNLILQHGDLNALECVEIYAKKNLKNTKVYMPYIGQEMEF